MVSAVNMPTSRMRGAPQGRPPQLNGMRLQRAGVGPLPLASEAAVKERLEGDEAVRMWNLVRRRCPWLSRDDMDVVEQLANAAAVMVRCRKELFARLDAGDLVAAAKARVMWSGASQMLYKFQSDIGLTQPSRGRYLQALADAENVEYDEFAV